MNNPHVAEGCMDIGAAPPEPHIAPEPKPVEREDLRARCLRKIQEDEAFAKQAKEALEGLGTMIRFPTDFWHGWYVELAGDDVERPE